MKRENISNCQENWDNMTPLNGGRFCHNCEKKVYDFTDMNKDEIIELQWRNNFSLCGRYSEKSFQSKASKIKMPNLKLKPALAAGAIIAGLSQMPLNAQKIERQKIEQREAHTAANEVKEVKTKEYLLNGKMIDKDTEEVLPFASIHIKGKKEGTISELDGSFSLSYNVKENSTLTDTLVFSYVGYNTVYVPIVDFIKKGSKQGMEKQANGTIEIIELEPQKITMGIAICGGLISCERPPLRKRVWWKIKNIFR